MLYLRNNCQVQCLEAFPLLSSWRVMGFTFGPLIHFELIFECGVQDKGLTFFFFFWHMNMQFSHHCLLKRLPFLVDWSWHHCRRSFAHIHDSLFLGCLFYSIGVFVFWWQYHTVMKIICLSLFSCSVVSDSVQFYELSPSRLLSPRNFSGKNIEVGCHFLHQGTSQPRDQTHVFV